MTAIIPSEPDEDDNDAMGVEPEEDSGAGYGNHAPDPRTDDDGVK